MEFKESKLTNQQLQAVASQVLNRSDQGVVNAWLEKMARPDCAPDYFRNDIINFITTRAGRHPDEIAKGMAERAAAAQKPTHAPPTSAPAPAPKYRMPVFVNCATCGKDVLVPEDKAGTPQYCDQKCKDKFASTQTSLLAEGQKFLEMVGSRYYDSDRNFKLLTDYLFSKNKKFTADNLLDAFFALKDQLLQPLSIRDIEAMTAEQLEARRRIDPDLGNANLKKVRQYQTGGTN